MDNLLTDNIHGQLGESPNKLYKSYVAWFKKTYSSDKKPLAFKPWLEWAKKKKIVMNADGSNVGQTLELKIREIQLSYVLIGAGLGAGVAAALKNKNVHWFAVGGALVGVILSFVFPKIKVESSGGGSAKSGGGGGSSGGGGGVSASNTLPIQNPIVVVQPISPRPVNRTAIRPAVQTATSPSTPPIGSSSVSAPQPSTQTVSTVSSTPSGAGGGAISAVTP